MVQILPRKQTFMESLVGNLGETLPGAVDKLIERKRGESQLEEENQALAGQGINLKGIRNPKLREGLLEQYQKKQKATEDQQLESQTEEFILENFGEKGLSLYKSAKTEGAKTEAFKYMLEDKQRLDNLITQFDDENKSNIENKLGMPPGSVPRGTSIGNQTTQMLGNEPYQTTDHVDMFSQNEPFQENESVAPTTNNRKIGRTNKEKVTEELQDKKYKQELEIFEKTQRQKHHEESAKFDEKIREDADRAEKQVSATNSIMKHAKKTSPASAYNLFRGMGPIADKIADAFKTKDEAAIKTEIPNLIDGWKDVFGVRLSDADLKVIQDKLPDIGNNPEAMETIAKIIQKYAQIPIKKAEIASQVRKENKGLRPLGFENEVNERLSKWREEQTKHELTDEDINFYLEKANGDPDLAEKLAKEDGKTW